MIKANKSLGQNFLIDQNKILNIIDSLFKLNDNDFIEVGPGLGALTIPIIERGRKVIAIELDERCSDFLENSNIENLTLIRGDALKVDFSKYTNLNFISNLPYYISTPILFKAIEIGFNFIAVMLPSDIVDRIISDKEKKSYGRLSVSIQSMYKLNKIIDVKAGCFTPRPNINSKFIILERYDSLDKEFLSFIKECFFIKRKTLLNSLKLANSNSYDKVVEYLNSNNIRHSIRGEQISIQEFKDIWLFLESK